MELLDIVIQGRDGGACTLTVVRKRAEEGPDLRAIGWMGFGDRWVVENMIERRARVWETVGNLNIQLLNRQA